MRPNLRIDPDPAGNTKTEPNMPAIKAARKASPAKAAKAVPVVAAVAAKPANAHEAFIASRDAAQALATPVYNGLSLAVHRSAKRPKLADYIARIGSPVQCASSATTRDLSALAVIKSATGNKPGAAFDPASYGADIGTISRLASLKLIGLSDGKPVLTALGASHKA